MRNKSVLLRAVLGVVMCVSTFVATADEPAGAGNVGELRALQAEVAVLKAKIAKANAQADLAKAGKPDRGPGAGGAGYAPPEMAMTSPRGGRPGAPGRGMEPTGIPPDSIKVQGVHGVGNKLVASMVVQGGEPRDVAVGEVVRGVRVVSIDMDAVIVESGGQRSTLPVVVPSQTGGAERVAPSPFAQPLPGMVPGGVPPQ